jgi:hypothetical protein
MFALTKEARMNQPSRKPQFRNRIGLPVDLCGPYASDEVDLRQMACTLQIDQTEVGIELPAEVLRRLQRQGEESEVVLRFPGNRSIAVDVMPILTEKQRKTAAGWSAEMGDFDRF